MESEPQADQVPFWIRFQARLLLGVVFGLVIAVFALSGPPALWLCGLPFLAGIGFNVGMFWLGDPIYPRVRTKLPLLYLASALTVGVILFAIAYLPEQSAAIIIGLAFYVIGLFITAIIDLFLSQY